MTEEDRKVVERMRGRAEQCRRLARAILDRSASAVLLQMADEVEVDIKRLEGGQAIELTEHLHSPPQR